MEWKAETGEKKNDTTLRYQQHVIYPPSMSFSHFWRIQWPLVITHRQFDIRTCGWWMVGEWYPRIVHKWRLALGAKNHSYERASGWVGGLDLGRVNNCCMEEPKNETKSSCLVVIVIVIDRQCHDPTASWRCHGRSFGLVFSGSFDRQAASSIVRLSFRTGTVHCITIPVRVSADQRAEREGWQVVGLRIASSAVRDGCSGGARCCEWFELFHSIVTVVCCINGWLSWLEPMDSVTVGSRAWVDVWIWQDDGTSRATQEFTWPHAVGWLGNQILFDSFVGVRNGKREGCFFPIGSVVPSTSMKRKEETSSSSPVVVRITPLRYPLGCKAPHPRSGERLPSVWIVGCSRPRRSRRGVCAVWAPPAINRPTGPVCSRRGTDQGR